MRIENVASSPSTTGSAAARAHEREARLRFVDAAAAECDRLEVALGAARLETGALEVIGDVFGGLAMLGRAGVAALHRVARQERRRATTTVLRRLLAGHGRQRHTQRYGKQARDLIQDLSSCAAASPLEIEADAQ